jgi:hypothetical protein
MRIATCDFAGTNGTVIDTADTNWTEHGSYTGDMTIQDARAYPSGTTNSAYYRDETPGSANQIAAVVVRKLSDLGNAGVACRMNTGADTMIMSRIAWNSGQSAWWVYLQKVIAGTVTQITTYTVPSWTTGTDKTLRLEVSGQSPNISARVLLDGTQVISPQTITDSSLNATGKVGMRVPTPQLTSTTGSHTDTFNAWDDVASTLSSPTGTATGSTTASGTVSVNDAGGTLYAVATTSATSPTHTQVQAGQDHTGAAAAFAVGSGSGQAATATGTQNVSATGLTPATAYYWHYSYKDGGGTNASAVSSSSSFTTDADAILGVRVQFFLGGVPQINLTGIRVLWWDAATPSGAPDYESTTETTDSSAWLELDIDAVTSLAVGGNGFLLAYWLDGTNHQDSLVFASKMTVVDIS